MTTQIPPSIDIRSTYATGDGSCPEEMSISIPVESYGTGDIEILVDHFIKSLADVPMRTMRNRLKSVTSS